MSGNSAASDAIGPNRAYAGGGTAPNGTDENHRSIAAPCASHRRRRNTRHCFSFSSTPAPSHSPRLELRLRAARCAPVAPHHALLPPKEQKRLALRDWYEAHLPIGVHPFRAEWTYTRRVGRCRLRRRGLQPHMSNSSYAKALDSARFRLALATFPSIFRCGRWLPLAATHFHFIREIPMLSTYENGIASGLAIASGVAAAAGSATQGESGEALIPSLKTPATPLPASGVATPAINGINNENGSAQPDAVSRALLERAARATEDDGALLYTVTVSQLCYKQGRITVPPALVLASNGFYAAPPSSYSAAAAPSQGQSKTRYTTAGGRGAAPPYWPAVRAATASMPALAKLYAGGWRGVPEGERWWEEAFAACEGERKERLVPFVGSEAENKGVVDGRRSGLSGGLEGVRGL
ncbi:hypothetical protein DFH08DRAFT_957695 [Mycena albidolilacea]|uniref:Uncharacterized protein n=1 Tax=Mycena albidolilacea TaxID=1033008 RepID=A0AAD7A7K7_9AGAR|nr:hypothetical protein DFH08DRAFT_957695 [Mycena albidolilacea]